MYILFLCATVCIVFTFPRAQKESENVFIVQEAVSEKSVQTGNTIAPTVNKPQMSWTIWGFSTFDIIHISVNSKRTAIIRSSLMRTQNILRLESAFTHIHTGGRGCHASCSPDPRRNGWQKISKCHITFRLRTYELVFSSGAGGVGVELTAKQETLLETTLNN